MSLCMFCSPEFQVSSTVWSNSLYYVTFDAFPVTPGHTLVIPKKHIVSFFDLETQERDGLHEAIVAAKELIETIDKRRIYENIKARTINESSVRFCQSALDSDFIDKIPAAYNIGINDGRAAGRTIDHLHIHLIPRYE